MRLTDTSNKIKSSLARAIESPDLPKDIFMVLLIVLVGSGAFLLGRLSAADTVRKSELSVTSEAPLLATAIHTGVAPALAPQIPLEANVAGMYVGSKSGKTYHLPWCSGAKRIKEENKVWFASKAEAEARGYKAAGNCKGI